MNNIGTNVSSVCESIGNGVRLADYYAKPCSIQYNKKSEHATIIGGIITLLLYMVLTYYSIWRLTLLFTYERDTYISVNVQSPLHNRPPLYLKGSDVDFTIQVVNNDYDNDDNPYGEIKLHLYSSMNEEARQDDIIIPLTTKCRE